MKTITTHPFLIPLSDKIRGACRCFENFFGKPAKPSKNNKLSLEEEYSYLLTTPLEELMKDIGIEISTSNDNETFLLGQRPTIQ